MVCSKVGTGPRLVYTYIIIGHNSNIVTIVVEVGQYTQNSSSSQIWICPKTCGGLYKKCVIGRFYIQPMLVSKCMIFLGAHINRKTLGSLKFNKMSFEGLKWKCSNSFMTCSNKFKKGWKFKIDRLNQLTKNETLVFEKLVQKHIMINVFAFLKFVR